MTTITRVRQQKIREHSGGSAVSLGGKETGISGRAGRDRDQLVAARHGKPKSSNKGPRRDPGESIER